MDSYDKVVKVVAPKKQALQEAESEYESVMAGLLGKQEELAGLMQQLQKLESQLSVSRRQFSYCLLAYALEAALSQARILYMLQDPDEFHMLQDPHDLAYASRSR
jgi:Skp family chaperone for outer membrane proteins